MVDEIKTEEKDTFLKRMKRGFGVLLLKVRTLATKMNDAQNKQSDLKISEQSQTIPIESFSGMDMSYAPKDLGL